MHLATPLQIASVGKCLAKTGGAAEVDIQDSIAAVGKPLALGTVAPVVTRPGTIMHKEHHWQRLIRITVAVAAVIASSGQRVVTDQIQSVTRLDDDRTYSYQRQVLKRHTVREQELCVPFRAVVAVVPHRTVIHRVGNHPVPIIECPADDLKITVRNHA